MLDSLYNPLRDEVYGCFVNSERTGYNFVLWNYEYYSTKKVICALERPWSGCSFASDGTLYAIERNGDLYKVNIRDGAMTMIGRTGVTSDYLGDAVIDPATDKMYWSVTTDTDFGLYEVDIRTAKARKLYDMSNGEQLCGMYIPSDKAYESGAPAKISSVSLSVSGANLNGNLSFYSPSSTVGGDRLDTQTQLAYTVKANGEVIATGQCDAGKRVTVPVEVKEPDSYYFSVTTTNAAGESPASGTHKFMGPDTPRSPSFNVRPSGSEIKLSWSSVSSSGVNGGNVVTSAATYTVVRYPDKKIIAENVTTRSATDPFPAPGVRTEYYYTLTATANGKTSEPTKSASVWFGPIVPPVTGNFNNILSTAGWTIGSGWEYYSSDKCMQAYGSKGFDAWVFSPVVKVQAGTSYTLSVDLGTSNYADETVEVKWGNAPTVEAMTNTAIAPVTFRSTQAKTLEGEIVAATTGEIYVGVHAMTESSSRTVNFFGYAISSGITATAPAAVSEFSAVSPTDGSRKVTLTFTAPSLAMDGSALDGESALTKIDIFRDDKLLTTLTDNIVAGGKVEYIDDSDDLTFGTHVYRVVPVNAYGNGSATEAEVLVGARKPVAPESAVMTEDGNTGRVVISWSPVNTDVDGNTFSEDAVTYRVIDRSYNTVASNVKGTSVSVDAVDPGTQAFCQFAVYAVTAGGESDKMAATAYKPVGTPYQAPWSESFEGKNVSSIFGYNYINGKQPWEFSSEHDWGITPQDGDGGFAFLEAYGDLTALVTGKIDLDGVGRPAFTYYTYNYIGSISNPTNTLSVEVDNGNGRGFVKVNTTVVAKTGPENSWNKVVVPLDDYEGQTIILRIVPGDLNLALYTLDNLAVTTHADFNLVASRLIVPDVVDTDKPFEVSAVVVNNGENPVNNYTVELLRDGELTTYVDCGRIEPEESKTITFEQTLSVADGEYAEYQAVIICGNDEVESDNASPLAKVGIIAPSVPVVKDLVAAESDGGAVLTWSAPDMATAAPAAITETFENAESWTNNVNGWKFIDVDAIPVGGIQINGFPCTGLQSWFIADRNSSCFDPSNLSEGTDMTRWDAKSGSKFMVSSYVQRSNISYQSDDWAITPRLHDGPQAFSFYAKSFDPKYLETFEVLASSGTTNTDDFVKVGSAMDVPSAWTQYRFKLPEGTRYAAIRSRSFDKFFLFVDDVTFIPADGEAVANTIIGYNVYRNGEKLNSTPLTTPRYVDADARPDRDYTYHVTAVYDNSGESRLSNGANLRISGIGDITGESGVRISVENSAIVVRGLDEGTATVTSVDGRTVAAGVAGQELSFRVAPGVYIVVAGARVAKVSVK